MKKRGFTLIELLAVIIILAIVALIATPMVLDVIEDAKKSAAGSELNMIVSGINNYCAAADSKDQLNNTHDSICLNTAKDGYEVKAAEVSQMVKLGKSEVLPTDGAGAPVTLTYGLTGLTEIVIESNGYTCKYLNGKSACKKGIDLKIADFPVVE